MSASIGMFPEVLCGQAYVLALFHCIMYFLVDIQLTFSCCKFNFQTSDIFQVFLPHPQLMQNTSYIYIYTISISVNTVLFSYIHFFFSGDIYYSDKGSISTLEN